ncbi:tryptophan-rich sensory protein [Candidatus Saccharibacteria bacterium]|nr:tryptophan-rich sensory protein [Candidatus Saccharibacteria bacterium]
MILIKSRDYGLQLVLNFCWTIIFFNFGLFYVAFGVLIVMWALIIVLMINSAKISKAAMFCLLPYLLWTTFAAYLNISIAILNA